MIIYYNIIKLKLKYPNRISDGMELEEELAEAGQRVSGLGLRKSEPQCFPTPLVLEDPQVLSLKNQPLCLHMSLHLCQGQDDDSAGLQAYKGWGLGFRGLGFRV